MGNDHLKDLPQADRSNAFEVAAAPLKTELT